jgi:hypothetical protein
VQEGGQQSLLLNITVVLVYLITKIKINEGNYNTPSTHTIYATRTTYTFIVPTTQILRSSTNSY